MQLRWTFDNTWSRLSSEHTLVSLQLFHSLIYSCEATDLTSSKWRVCKHKAACEWTNRNRTLCRSHSVHWGIKEWWVHKESVNLLAVVGTINQHKYITSSHFISLMPQPSYIKIQKTDETKDTVSSSCYFKNKLHWTVGCINGAILLMIDWIYQHCSTQHFPLYFIIRISVLNLTEMDKPVPAATRMNNFPFIIGKILISVQPSSKEPDNLLYATAESTALSL